jgi:broad-specificity NMP kinase
MINIILGPPGTGKTTRKKLMVLLGIKLVSFLSHKKQLMKLEIGPEINFKHQEKS